MYISIVWWHVLYPVHEPRTCFQFMPAKLLLFLTFSISLDDYILIGLSNIDSKPFLTWVLLRGTLPIKPLKDTQQESSYNIIQWLYDMIYVYDIMWWPDFFHMKQIDAFYYLKSFNLLSPAFYKQHNLSDIGWVIFKIHKALFKEASIFSSFSSPVPFLVKPCVQPFGIPLLPPPEKQFSMNIFWAIIY